jgi:hypothetical protein
MRREDMASRWRMSDVMGIIKRKNAENVNVVVPF